MSHANSTLLLPTLMEQKLSQIGKRQMAIAVLRAITVGLSVFIIAMLIAMLIDWQFTLFSTSVRLGLTTSAILGAIGSSLIIGFPPLLSALKRVRAASSADAGIPQLEERWQTVVTLAESDRRSKSAVALAMLEQVTSEAVAIGRLVQPRRVADQTSLKRAIKSLAVCSTVLLGFMAIDLPQTSVLLRRFLAPMTNISATSMHCISGDITVPRGEFVDLATETSGLQRAFAMLSIVRSGARPDLIEVAADKKQAYRFAHRIQADESFQYQLRAGDGQTSWHQVTVVDYPAFAEVKLTVISPAYLKRANIEKTVFPARLKVPQGSLLTLQMLPKAPLQRFELTSAPDNDSKDKSTAQATNHELTPDADGWYRFQTQLIENISLTPQLWNDHGLTNEDRTVCRIQVIADNAPVARVLSSTDELSVANDDVVDIKFEAHDDHGIAKAELVIYDESSKEEGKPAEILKVVPIPLGDQELEKHVIATTQLDLKQLNLKPGAQISYAVRVTDNRATSQEISNGPEKSGDSAKAKDELASTTAARDSQRPADPLNSTSDRSLTKNDLGPGQSEKNADLSKPVNAEASATDKAEADAEDMTAMVSRESEDGSEPTDRTNRTKSATSPKARSSASTTSDSSTDPLVVEEKQDNLPDGREAVNEKSSSKSARRTSLGESKANPDAPSTDSAEMVQDKAESTDETESDGPTVSRKQIGQKSSKSARRTPPDESKANPESQSTDSEEMVQDEAESGDETENKPDRSAASRKQMNRKPPSKSAKDELTAAQDANADSPQPESSNEDQGGTDSIVKKPKDSNPNPKSSKPADLTPKEDPSGDNPADDASGKPTTAELSGESEANKPRNQEDEKTPMPGDSANTDAKNSENDKPQSKLPEPSTTERKKTQGQKAQGDLDLAPPPDKMFASNPQESSDGQDSETKRRRLKITARLSAVAESREIRKAETGNIRERVAEIDAMLAIVETGLTRVVNREIPDDDRSAQFKLLDTQLGDVEGKISTLRKRTRDSEFEFMGLQMVEIGRSHITPAREKVFTAIREPAIGSDGSSSSALQQIVRARELLAAMLVRFDRAAQDKKLAEELEQGIKFYEIYVEKMQALLREARQNQNPLERKMAVLEIGQDYLDRYAEVLAMRRDMFAEFGRILGDDPRLLARYLDLVKRRRTSLRNQLTELAKRQQETATELSGWVASDEAQRQDLWTVAVELRMQASSQLAKDAAELAERIEKQFPLVLEATQQTQARVIELGKQIAETSRAISLEAKRQIRQPDTTIDLRPKARQLVQLFVDLDAMLEQLNFENSNLTDVTTYVSGRLLESRTVADQAGSWRQTADFVHARQYPKMIEVDQHRLTIDTELLRLDMLGIETELSAQFQQLAEKKIPEDIAQMIRELQQLMLEITFVQAGATFEMSTDHLPLADKLSKETTDSFAKAEALFDRIRVAVAAALDEIAPRNPSVADLQDPKLDEFLTQLEREPNIEAQLGLGERPTNLRVIADTMQMQETGGNFLGDAENAARGRAQEEMGQGKEAMKPEPKSEKPEVEMSEKEREELQQARELEAMLAKQLAELKERAKDPMTSPAEREQIAQKQEELQQKMDELTQASNAAKLAMQLKEDLMRVLAAIKEDANEPPKENEPVDKAKMDQLAKDLDRIVQQVSNEPNSEKRWKLVAEFERKKQVLKAIARGQHIPDDQWNKLLSSLDDGLWQIGGRTLPEEYRKAIEQYQEQIRRLTNDSNDKGR